MKTQSTALVIPEIPVIAAIAGMSAFLLAVYFGWMGAPAGAGANFCEAPHQGLIIQPVNTWSNIGFMIVGLLIAWQQYQKKFSEHNNAFSRSPFYGTFYATLSVLLGPGSMAMHATTTHVGGFFDLLSMYMIASFLVTYAFKRLFYWRVQSFSIAFILLLSFCIYCHFQDIKPPMVGHFGSFIFGCLLILTGVIEVPMLWRKDRSIKAWYGIGAILTMFLAFFIWNMSLSGGPWCDPSSLVQGHGIWHLLNAASIYLLFRYYVSENEPTIIN
jgi:hypothetical protein